MLSENAIPLAFLTTGLHRYWWTAGLLLVFFLVPVFQRLRLKGQFASVERLKILEEKRLAGKLRLLLLHHEGKAFLLADNGQALAFHRLPAKGESHASSKP